MASAPKRDRCCCDKIRACLSWWPVDAAGTSPLYERVAVALSESGKALRAIETALAAAYAARDGDAAEHSFVHRRYRQVPDVLAAFKPAALAGPDSLCREMAGASIGRYGALAG
jgi:hypothetical protein